MTEVNDEPGRVRRAWRAFRRWRRTRPFWGGLLVTLGGLEILASERAPLPVIVHIGLQGIAGYLTPIILVICGLLLLFHPVQRLFYSLIAIVLSLGSWVTSNLGGFIIGMLLGLVGGSLAFAWVQRDRREQVRRRSAPPPRTTTSVGIGLVRGEHPAGDQAVRGEHPAGGQADRRDGDLRGARQPDAGEREASGRGRTWRGAGKHGAGPRGPVAASLPVPLVPLAPLTLSVLAALATRGLMTGTVQVPALSAVPLLTSPTSFPSFPPTPSASARPSVRPTATATPTTDPSPAASPSPSASASASASPSASPAPSRPARSPRALLSAGMPAAPVAADRSEFTSSFAILDGVSYDGIASVPTAHGRELMLKFSMSDLKLPGIVLTASQGGQAFMTKDSTLELSGHVILYTTRISGTLNGIRVTFTSADPPSSLRPDLTLANVVAEQPFVTARTLWAVGSQAGSG